MPRAQHTFACTLRFDSSQRVTPTEQVLQNVTKKLDDVLTSKVFHTTAPPSLACGYPCVLQITVAVATFSAAKLRERVLQSYLKLPTYAGPRFFA